MTDAAGPVAHRHAEGRGSGAPGRMARGVLYALLLLDIALYARHGRPTELLDTLAWVVLLLLFELETGGWRLPARATPLVHPLRLLASAGVAAACIGYALEAQWLDLANEMTWLLVVILLEVELRLSAHWRRTHRVRRMLSRLCYAALAVFVLVWLAEAFAGTAGVDRHALLDAWDAALWLLAFWTIEWNMLRTPAGGRAAALNR